MKCCDVPVRQTFFKRATPSEESSANGCIEGTTDMNVEEEN